MTDDEIDARLAALMAGPAAAPDPAFADHVVALARFDLARRRARRRAFARVGREALALVAVLATFALLARLPSGPAAGLGDALPLASPAMLGVILLGLWAAAVNRPSPAP
jgi:hypothetical protein